MRTTTFVAFALALTGCARSCGRDHPYVPYAVGDAPSVTAADAGAPQGSSVGTVPGPEPTSTAEPALLAPPHATKWTAGGLELLAPEGTELLSAIVRDVDGDGRPDAIALARGVAPENKPAEVGPATLLYYRGAEHPVPQTLATAPSPRTDAGCAPVARLERVGPRSALAEVGAACTSGAAARVLWVVRLAKDPGLAFDLAIADPPAAPKLSIDVDADDRDKDGLDDITLRIAIEGGSAPFEPGPKLTAKLAWFDRTAGESRDSDEPNASLSALAAHATGKAKSAKTAPEVPPYVAQLRALYRAMCKEGGAPRLTRPRANDGQDARADARYAIPCGSSKPLEEAGVAEVRALGLMGDAIRAFAAADVAQLAPATKTAARTTELDKSLAQVAPFVDARSTRTLPQQTLSKHGPHPAWGPIAFEASGKLLVKKDGKIVRVDPDTGDEEATDIAPWSEQVVSPDGKSRWLEAYHACEGVALRATFVPLGDGDMKDVLLPVAPTLGTRCPGARGEAAPAIAIAWTPRGLEAIVAGQPLLVRPDAGSAAILASPLDEPPSPGSPRSPSGKAIAIALKSGVLVRTQTKSFRLRAKELEPYEGLRGCTVSDDAHHVACDRQGKIVSAVVD